MTALTINVVGTPAPQGSKRAFVVNGRPVMAESSKRVKPWRQDVTEAAREACLQDPDGWLHVGPLAVEITFYISRPRYHYRTGRHAGELKPNAPAYVDKKPDNDKLLRSTLDALTTSGLIRDDAQIADLRGVKRYADAATGARITITHLDPAGAPTALGEDANGAPATTTEGALW